MNVDLQDARVLVVGASGGIGSAVLTAFREAGAKVDHPARLQLDITDDDSVAAYFTSADTYDHVVVAAAQTTDGVGGRALAG